MNVESLVIALYLLSGIFLLFFVFGLRRLFAFTLSWPFVFFRSSLYLITCLLFLLAANQLSRFFPVFPQQPIVSISMIKIQEKQYRLHIQNAENNSRVQLNSAEAAGNLLINGDQWRLDMRILTWHPFLAQLGLQPLYKLERMNGRYHSIEDEQLLPRSLYELDNPDLTAGYWQLLLPYLKGTLFNSYYGAAVYAPMSDAAQYGVFLNANGTELKALNKEAEQALSNW